MSITRRGFFIGSGLVGGGLILGFYLRPQQPIPNTLEGSFQPNAWLQITEDGSVVFQLDKVEMGQGVITSLPTVMAEELDFPPHEIHIEMAGVHPDFRNAAIGAQLTGGSTSVMSSWLPLRQAGAVARQLLIEAAARRWNINANKCQTRSGLVVHPSNGEALSYFELAKEAKSITLNKEVTLKNPGSFQWIGQSTPRFDMVDKINGMAKFGSDIDMPGIKIAIVKRCPYFGGRLVSFDDSKAKNVEGVVKITQIHSGVAIVADSYWQASKAAKQLQIKWEKGPLTGLDSDKIRHEQEKALEEKEAFYHIEEGDADQAFNAADKKLTANYAAPYFHHSPMEPQNTTALVEGDKCEVWCPSQGPDIARAIISHYTGLKREHITVHTTLLGGGFGRRGYVDFAGEAGAIAKVCPGQPVKLLWSREDDMQHDFYRPATFHGIQASITKKGEISSWQHKLVSTSIVQGFGVDMFSAILPSWVPTQIARNVGQGFSNFIAEYDPSISEGAHIPYQIENIQVGSILYDPGIPTGFWRSVGHSHNAFVVESFIDECAYAAKKFPVEFRRSLLKSKPRHLGVIDAVVELSGINHQKNNQGFAVHESFGSFVAQVVEVTVSDQEFSVDKVYCAVDCGIVVNPDIVRQQIEGGIIYALTAAIKEPVKFKDGATVQSNFHDLPVLRINETPDIEIVIIESQEDPGGVGEIGVPPLAPALANALFAATGQRLREMPFVLNPA